jgi:LPXTG-site transpeptidase (sortase) family protein
LARQLAVIVAAFLLFELPISAFIQQNRQRRLATELGTPTSAIAAGDALAVLQIEKIKLNEVVVEGDSPDVLRGGPGHRPGTPSPGAPGNSVIVGRRLRYGGPMGRVGELTRGDEIVVWVRNAQHPVLFKVTQKRRVGESSRPPVADSNARLTLVTSASGLPTADLLLVEGELVGTVPAATKEPSSAGAREPRKDGPARTWATSVSVPMHLLAAAVWIAVLLGLRAGFRWLRRTFPPATTLVLVAPMAAFAFLGLALTLDGVTPRLL